MEAIVNNAHRYILFYSAKAGCTSLRSFYLDLHKSEMSQAEIEGLDDYHNLHEVQPFDVTQNYSGYYKFLISRNPYTRIVSAFLDQYVYARNPGVQTMLDNVPAVGREPLCFIEFLRYLVSVPDAARDPHFQTQAYFAYDGYFPKRRNIFRRGTMVSKLNYRGDISKFNHHLRRIYHKIFKNNQPMLTQSLKKIDELQKMNSSFYSKNDYPDAALLSVDELDEMIYPPKPQDFYSSKEARELIAGIYADDFSLFKYSRKKIPQRHSATDQNVVPEDFDWQTYLLISPDLQLAGMTTERAVVRHYLEFGRYEALRSYKIEAPEGFDWQRYLEINQSVISSQIDNERDALIHYLGYGQRQNLSF